MSLVSEGRIPGEDRIDLMKREIDALQVQVMKDRGPCTGRCPSSCRWWCR
jgi:hypothetical protein